MAARADVTLFSTDFQNAAPGPYTNNAVINAGRAAGEQLNVLLGATATGTAKVEVVQFDADRKMLAMTCPTGLGRHGFIFEVKNIFADPEQLSIQGNNQIVGQFDIVFPFYNNMNTAEIDIMLCSGGDSTEDALMRLFLLNYGRVSFVANNRRDSGKFLAAGSSHTYRVRFYGDMGIGLDAGAFRWGFTITEPGNKNALVHDVSDIIRSCPNRKTLAGPPDRFIIRAGYVASTPPAEPLLYFTNFHVMAYPKVRAM